MMCSNIQVVLLYNIYIIYISVNFLSHLWSNFVLKTISAKGLALWPSEAVLSQVSSDFLMLRFMGQKITGESSTKIINPNLFVSNLNILQLLQELTEKNIDFVKIENLYSFNNIACFSSGQGE